MEWEEPSTARPIHAPVCEWRGGCRAVAPSRAAPRAPQRTTHTHRAPWWGRHVCQRAGLWVQERGMATGLLPVQVQNELLADADRILLDWGEALKAQVPKRGMTSCLNTSHDSSQACL